MAQRDTGAELPRVGFATIDEILQELAGKANDGPLPCGVMAVEGAGNPEPDLPTPQQVIAYVIATLARLQARQQLTGTGEADITAPFNLTQMAARWLKDRDRDAKGKANPSAGDAQHIQSAAASLPKPTVPAGAAGIRVAVQLGEAVDAAWSSSAVMDVFNPLIGAFRRVILSYACPGPNLIPKAFEKEFQQALKVTLRVRDEVYLPTIGTVRKLIEAAFPDWSDVQVRNAALVLISQTVMDVLVPLNYYQRAVEHADVPEYQAVFKPLRMAIEAFYEKLFKESEKFLLVMTFDEGPFTIPKKGIIGLNIVAWPQYTLAAAIFMVAVHAHEATHGFNANKLKLREIATLMVEVITKAFASGEVKAAPIMFGDQELDPVEFLAAWLVRTVDETTADVGGITILGKAFLDNLLTFFAKLNAGKESIEGAVELLRNYTVYSFDGQLSIEVHLPDLLRALALGAAMLKRMGKAKEAAEIYARAFQAARSPLPAMVTLINQDRSPLNPLRDVKIQVPTELMLQVIEKIVEVYFTPVPSLGGTSVVDFIGPFVNDKLAADIAKDLLLGKTSVPEGYLGSKTDLVIAIVAAVQVAALKAAGDDRGNDADWIAALEEAGDRRNLLTVIDRRAQEMLRNVADKFESPAPAAPASK